MESLYLNWSIWIINNEILQLLLGILFEWFYPHFTNANKELDKLGQSSTNYWLITNN